MNYVPPQGRLVLCCPSVCLSVHLSAHNSPLARFQKNHLPKFNHTPQTYTWVGSDELIRFWRVWPWYLGHSNLINSGRPNWGWGTSCETPASLSHIFLLYTVCSLSKLSKYEVHARMMGWQFCKHYCSFDIWFLCYHFFPFFAAFTPTRCGGQSDAATTTVGADRSHITVDSTHASLQLTLHPPVPTVTVAGRLILPSACTPHPGCNPEYQSYSLHTIIHAVQQEKCHDVSNSWWQHSGTDHKSIQEQSH